MSKLGKVLVAMSGGIDSTVSAILLHEMGYEVVGLTMKTWDYASSGGSKKETGCCSLDSINDARSIAVEVGFPHYILDMREEFGESVIDDFTSEYMAGRTPNPCIMCNTHIKWDALLRRADMMDCEFIATGHYAKIKHENDRYFVSMGKDAKKDQSYVLWGLTQDVLKRTIFPVGDMIKTDIRKLMLDKGFSEMSKKGESYEICFIPDNDYRAFLTRKHPELLDKKGKFLNTSGEVIGEHNGYPFYTVGQRKGLGLAAGVPLFVTEIRPDTNEVVVGEYHDLDKQEMFVERVNLQKFEKITEGTPVTTKIRYKHRGESSIIGPSRYFDANSGSCVAVSFMAPVQGIAPGQSAVFYDGQDVVGGGIITI